MMLPYSVPIVPLSTRIAFSCCAASCRCCCSTALVSGSLVSALLRTREVSWVCGTEGQKKDELGWVCGGKTGSKSAWERCRAGCEHVPRCTLLRSNPKQLTVTFIACARSWFAKALEAIRSPRVSRSVTCTPRRVVAHAQATYVSSTCLQTPRSNALIASDSTPCRARHAKPCPAEVVLACRSLSKLRATERYSRPTERPMQSVGSSTQSTTTVLHWMARP